MLPWASTSIFQPPTQAFPKAVKRLHQTYRAPGICRIRKAPRHMPWVPGPSGRSGHGQDMVTVSREQALWRRSKDQAKWLGGGGG